LCATRRKEITSEIAGLRMGMPEREAVEREERESAAARAAALAQVTGAERIEAETKEALESVAPRWLAAQTGRDERQRLEKELAVVDGELGALRRSEERVAHELGEVAEARAALQPLLPDVDAFEPVRVELEAQRALAAHDGRRRALLETQRELTDEGAALRDQRAKLERA